MTIAVMAIIFIMFIIPRNFNVSF